MTKLRKAMVLAAGLGTRMRPLTETLPKPLVEVNGRPLIDHVLDRLAQLQVEEAVVNLHHHADLLEAHLKAYSGPPRVVLSDERDALLETGGGVRRALGHFGDAPFFAINSDTIWIEGMRPNLARMESVFDPERMDVLLLLASTALSIGYDGPGDFLMDAEGRLTRRPERVMAPFVYAGAAILKPGLFADTPEWAFSLNRIFDRAREADRLFGIRLEGTWMHVGTPDAIAAAEDAIRRSSD